MAYDLEKYRRKRERVLGVRKRGPGFTTFVTLLALFMVIGLGWVVIPKSISLLASRQQEDVIFKIQGGAGLPARLPDGLLAEISGQEGVRKAELDHGGSRVVVTFDRRRTGPERIAAYFANQGIDAVLLNVVDHRQHMTTMAKEAEL